MKVMFVVPYPRSEAPSQRFRFEQQIEFLEANGIECHFQSFWDLNAWRVLYLSGNVLAKTLGFVRGWLRRFSLLFRLGGYDRVFLHREAAPVGPPVIEWLIAKVLRKKIIYDFDDAIWLPNVSDSNRFAARIKFHDKVKSICRWSWKISCGNAYLQDFAKQYNRCAFFIPTTVDTDRYKPAPQKTTDNKIVIGWTGSQSTNAYLENMDGVFASLARDVDFELMVISNQPPQLHHPFRFVNWQRESEVSDLAQLDVGLMPLTDNEWSLGKCAFKLIQYGALAIPAVASPVGANKSVVLENESGFFATTDGEWIAALKRLCSNAQLRMKMGAASRERIEAEYSQRAVRERYLALFQNDC